MKPDKTLHKLLNGEEVKIVALGDSLTYGWMTEYGFLDFLQTMLIKKFPHSYFKIINRGIPGDTAKDGLRRTESDVIRLSPDLVFIQFALNDAYTDYSPEDFKKNIESIILKIREKSDPEIVLLTSVALLNPEENMIAREFYSKIHECGIKYNLPVVSVNEYWEEKISAGIKHSSLVQADGIHPNEKGYQLMAEAVFEIF
jgi:lysophospholipase L1-like esterase